MRNGAPRAPVTSPTGGCSVPGTACWATRSAATTTTPPTSAAVPSAGPRPRSRRAIGSGDERDERDRPGDRDGDRGEEAGQDDRGRPGRDGSGADRARAVVVERERGQRPAHRDERHPRDGEHGPDARDVAPRRGPDAADQPEERALRLGQAGAGQRVPEHAVGEERHGHPDDDEPGAGRPAAQREHGRRGDERTGQRGAVDRGRRRSRADREDRGGAGPAGEADDVRAGQRVADDRLQQRPGQSRAPRPTSRPSTSRGRRRPVTMKRAPPSVPSSPPTTSAGDSGTAPSPRAAMPSATSARTRPATTSSRRRRSRVRERGDPGGDGRRRLPSPPAPGGLARPRRRGEPRSQRVPAARADQRR